MLTSIIFTVGLICLTLTTLMTSTALAMSFIFKVNSGDKTIKADSYHKGFAYIFHF